MEFIKTTASILKGAFNEEDTDSTKGDCKGHSSKFAVWCFQCLRAMSFAIWIVSFLKSGQQQCQLCAHIVMRSTLIREYLANLHQENTLGGTVSHRGTQVSVFDSYWMLFGSKRCSTKGPLQQCSVPLLEDPCLLTPFITNHNWHQ